MPGKIRTLVVALVLVCAPAILFLVASKAGRGPARAPAPEPNGYLDFVKAGQGLRGDVGNFQTLEQAELRNLIATNAESLRCLRLGLTRQCLMPMDAVLTNSTGMLNQLAVMKRLVQLLAAEGRLREMDDRAADAARSYTDAIRFGNEISRGGMLITRLVGIACESIGCHALASLVARLDRAEARVVLRELETIDVRRVTWPEVLQNERYYCHHQGAARYNILLRAISWWQSREAMARAEAKHKIITAHERLLAGELALRGYQTERGHPPAALEELVTNYLAKVPQDPFTNQVLIYRPQGTNWLLYSIGPDGVDDGGRPAARGWPVKGDIRFDSSW